jgi:hypothetical protein
VEALAPCTVVLVGGRLIVGAGVGVAAIAAPLYAVELALAALRERFISADQFVVTAGIFAAVLIDGWSRPPREGRSPLLGDGSGTCLLVCALTNAKSHVW